MTTPRKPGLLHDEQGAKSAMRHLLLLIVVPVVVTMTIVEICGRHIQPTVWTFWGGFTSLLVVGCFGPRMAQYLAPQIGTIVSAIKDAAVERRRKEGGGDFEATP